MEATNDELIYDAYREKMDAFMDGDQWTPEQSRLLRAGAAEIVARAKARFVQVQHNLDKASTSPLAPTLSIGGAKARAITVLANGLIAWADTGEVVIIELGKSLAMTGSGAMCATADPAVSMSEAESDLHQERMDDGAAIVRAMKFA